MVKFLKRIYKLKIEICLLFIIVIGFIFRIYKISRLNLYPDEGVYTLSVKDFLYSNISAWSSQSWQPPLFTWINSVPVILFGLNEFSIRFSSAIFGTLTIPLVYYLAKLWYGKRQAILAAIIIAVLPVHIIYSRTAFSDVMQAFFLLVSILSAELLFAKEGKKFLLIFLSGIFFAFSFLVKYNSIVLWGLYWLFILMYPLIKKERRIFNRNLYYAIVSNLIAFAAILVIILSSGGIERLIYAVNNFIFLTAVQSTLHHNTYYFHFVVLVEALSPLLAFILPFAMLYFLISKKRARADILIAFLFVSYYLIISFQQRRYVRHQIIVIPFLVIVISRFLSPLTEKMKIMSSYLVLSIIIFGTAGWSVYEINKIKDYHPWSDLAYYLKFNYPNAAVHGSPTKGKIVKYYLPGADYSGKIESLKKNDLVVFTWLYNNTTTLGDYPTDEQMIFYPKRHYQTDYSPEFTMYVLRNGQLIKTFEFKRKTTMWLYQIKTIGPYEKYEEKTESMEDKVKIYAVWGFICKGWNKNSIVKSIMLKVFSRDQLATVNKKCYST